MHLFCTCMFVFFTFYMPKKYLHVFTAIIIFCNYIYIYPYTVDPSLTLNPTARTTKPVPDLTRIPPQLQQKVFCKHNKYIVPIFVCKDSS